MRSFKTQIGTAAVMLLILGFVLARRIKEHSSEPADPQNVIYEMVNAAKAGDVKRYLGCFTGTLSETLRGSLSDSTNSAFAHYLRESNAGITGLALGEPLGVTSKQVKLRVEYVYQDRNEAQVIHLHQVVGRWKIARMDDAQQMRALIPYGTPVGSVANLKTRAR